MSLRQVLCVGRSAQLPGRRYFSKTPVRSHNVENHQPNSLERRFLVWCGKYKNVDEVPNFVSQDVMERCRNKVRIRMANIMMVLTAIGCIYMVYSGKQAVKRGENMTKKNLEWHKKYNEMAENKQSN